MKQGKYCLQRLMCGLVLVMLAAGMVGEPLPALAQAVARAPADVPNVLNAKDAAAYQRMMAQAKQGVRPAASLPSQLQDESLMPHVMATYYVHSNARIPYAELKNWLSQHRDLPQARALYDLAEVRRPAAPTQCHSVKKTIKIKNKKTGKLERKTMNRNICKAVGNRPELPPVPLAILKQQRKRAAVIAAREAEYDGLPAAVAQQRRRLLGDVWRQRGRGDYAGALATLTSVGARQAVGHERWQAEVVKIAHYYAQKKMHAQTRNAALIAANVPGPERDTALWLAGMASYRAGNTASAAQSWQVLAREEPVKGIYYARGAWWGARAFRELGRSRDADAMLQQAARDGTSFYGQLAATELGQSRKVDFTAPAIRRREITQMMQNPAVRRAVALAQIGETGLAQDEVKLAYEDIPYQYTRALAGMGLALHMPGTALQAGKDLLQRGELIPAALYPLAHTWRPAGPQLVERELMLAVMRQESAFQPTVGSHVGAQGLMQLMPATARYIAKLAGRPSPDRGDLHDPETNLTLAQDYLKYLNTKLDGNLILVVAAYNGGIGNVQRWLSRGVTPRNDPLLFIESIPFDETKDYVEKVMANLWLYQEQMGVKPVSRDALARGYWPLKFAGRNEVTRVAMRD